MNPPYFIVFYFIFIGILIIMWKGTNNVCKTFADYYSDRDQNPNCYHNPDNELETHQIIQRHGYPVEVHTVTTEDGYILTLFRIPHNLKSNTTGKPVLVQHGVALNSGAFVISGKKSLGFLLADAGFDVWLGNFRGSRYSRKHTYLSTQSSSYWQFSLHHLGVFDLPAQINHITKITGAKIIYVGFSMGSTAGYIYSSMHHGDARESLELFVGVAPVVFLQNILLVKMASYIWHVASEIVEYVTHGELYLRRPLPDIIYQIVCFPFPFQMNICQLPDMLTLGWNYADNDPETLPICLSYNNDAVGSKILSHYSQMILSGNFQQFDYGEEKNERMYGSTSPPLYPLSRIGVDNYLIYAENDNIATEQNVKKLFGNLPAAPNNHTMHRIRNSDYTHVDILCGRTAARLVYEPLINFLYSRSK